MLKRHNPKEELTLYKLYYAAHPTSSRAAFNLGKALKEGGDRESALKYFRQSLKLLAEDHSISDFSRSFIQNSVPRMLEELDRD